MNRQYFNQNLRSLPVAIKRNEKPRERKTYLKKYIDEAMLFYAKDLNAISHNGVRQRSMKCLKFFYWMHKYYEGWSYDEIAFAMKGSKTNVRTGIRNTEAKIERYLKITKRGE